MSFNIAEIVAVTSETLQKKIRELLPSQQGFGVDLQASNVIIPIVDLTAAAEGSTVGTNLQTAINFGGNTAISVANSTSVIANTTGFYRIFGNASVRGGTGTRTVTFSMTDGLSIKNIWVLKLNGGSESISDNLDFVVFLTSGDSLSVTSNNAAAFFDGTVRQIADINGNLTNPVGFNPQ